jgi:hypothetical protein
MKKRVNFYLFLNVSFCVFHFPLLDVKIPVCSAEAIDKLSSCGKFAPGPINGEGRLILFNVLLWHGHFEM